MATSKITFFITLKAFLVPYIKGSHNTNMLCLLLIFQASTNQNQLFLVYPFHRIKYFPVSNLWIGYCFHVSIPDLKVFIWIYVWHLPQVFSDAFEGMYKGFHFNKTQAQKQYSYWFKMHRVSQPNGGCRL